MAETDSALPNPETSDKVSNLNGYDFTGVKTQFICKQLNRQDPSFNDPTNSNLQMAFYQQFMEQQLAN